MVISDMETWKRTSFLAFVVSCVCLSDKNCRETYLSPYVEFVDQMIPNVNNRVWKYSSLTLNACAKTCTLLRNSTEFPCYSFEYNWSGDYGVCILVNMSASRNANPQPDLKKAKNTSFFSLGQGKYSDLFEPKPKAVLQNHDEYISLHENVTSEECAHLCVMTLQFSCLSFAYNPTLHVCALSNKMAGSHHNLSQVSTYHYYQYSGYWLCNVTVRSGFSPRVLATPGYPNYVSSSRPCFIKIIAPEGRRVAVTMTSFYSNESDCEGGPRGVSIYDGTGDNPPPLDSLCAGSGELLPLTWKSSGEGVTVIFHTYSPISAMLQYTFENSDTCDGHICQNGAHCQPKESKYACACRQGFTGQYCETDIDDCVFSPCLFGGHCIDMINSYKCSCPTETTGEHCDIYLGACASNPCINSTCHPKISGYFCACSVGFTGINCEYDLDECYSNPCINGKCVNSVGKYLCECTSGYKGRNCEHRLGSHECNRENCQYGICSTNGSGSFCQCFPGFEGPSCDLNINECLSNPCIYGDCVDHYHGYRCNCSFGYTGSKCDTLMNDPCRDSPCAHGFCSVTDSGFVCLCENGYSGSLCDVIMVPCSNQPCKYGACVNNGSQFWCDCIPGYTGQKCDTMIDMCSMNRCIHGDCVSRNNQTFCVCHNGYIGEFCEQKDNVCSHLVCFHGNCIPHNDSYQCECDPGYTGNRCEMKISPCTSSPCSPNGVCRVQSDDVTYKCECVQGYKGLLCDVKYRACDDLPCKNGKCLESGYNFECICAEGYTGKHCDLVLPIPTTEEPSTSDPLCSQIPCRNGKCYFDEVSKDPVCICDVGFTGNFCEAIAINCNNNTCKNGQCGDTGSDVVCICHPGFTGKQCDAKIDLCQKVNCNDGKCVSLGNSFECNCFHGYSGRFCENPVRTCAQDPCVSGQCSNTKTGFVCNCDLGYTGALCEIHIQNDRKVECKLKCNHGACRVTNGTEVCKCLSGYFGFLCDQQIVKCTDSPCKENEECQDLNTGYRCVCRSGYTGLSCDHLIDTVGKVETTINVEWAIIGALVAILLTVLLIGGFVLYRRNRRGTVYISSPQSGNIKDNEHSISTTETSTHQTTTARCAGFCLNPTCSISRQQKSKSKKNVPSSPSSSSLSDASNKRNGRNGHNYDELSAANWQRLAETDQHLPQIRKDYDVPKNGLQDYPRPIRFVDSTSRDVSGIALAGRAQRRANNNPFETMGENKHGQSCPNLTTGTLEEFYFLLDGMECHEDQPTLQQPLKPDARCFHWISGAEEGKSEV